MKKSFSLPPKFNHVLYVSWHNSKFVECLVNCSKRDMKSTLMMENVLFWIRKMVRYQQRLIVNDKSVSVHDENIEENFAAKREEPAGWQQDSQNLRSPSTSPLTPARSPVKVTSNQETLEITSQKNGIFASDIYASSEQILIFVCEKDCKLVGYTECLGRFA